MSAALTWDPVDLAVVKNRAEFYNCKESLFQKAGTFIRHAEGLDEENLVYITRIFEHTFVSAGEKDIPLLNEITEAPGFIASYETLQSHFRNLRIEESYPHYVYRRKVVPEFSVAEGYRIAVMDPSDHPPLQAFLDTCTAEDVEEALIILDDPDEEIRMVYQGDTPAAYAGYRLWDHGLGDTGILVHPEHRRRGLGIAAVAEVTRSCLTNGRIPFYRTSRSNHGSMAIALGAGYEPIWETVFYTYDPA